MSIIQAVGLTKTYKEGPGAIKALDFVDLTLIKGELTAITGQSGSGKSTLLHLLGALDTPTSGKVYIEGKDISKYNDKKLSVLRRRRMGFVFQFFNLVPVLTAYENIVLPVLLDSRRIDEGYINQLVDSLGLKNRLHHQPGKLSGGEQQRVAIARALANKPLVVFADEPTGNLDSSSGQQVLKLLIESTKRFDQTLVMITHDMEIAKHADRIIQIHDGQIIGDKAVMK